MARARLDQVEREFEKYVGNGARIVSKDIDSKDISRVFAKDDREVVTRLPDATTFRTNK